MAKAPTAKPLIEAAPIAEAKPIGIPPRPLFTTVVEDAPAPRPTQLSAKTLAEQAAGVAKLAAYNAPVVEE